jgi:protein TonB
MLRTLPESRRRSQRSSRGLAFSVVLHSAVIGAAVVGTARAATAPDEDRAEEIVYVAPATREPPPPAPAAPRPATVAPRSEAMPALPAAPTLDFPPIVPTEIPPPGSVLTNADEFTNGLRARPDASGDAPTGSGLPSTSEIWSPNLVEREVQPLGGSAPRYPEMLRSANVEGTVIMEFVVDTTGRVEPSGVRVVEGAHPLFEAAVRQALRGMRFRPAEAGGHRVRQLVRQPFTFSLSR